MTTLPNQPGPPDSGMLFGDSLYPGDRNTPRVSMPDPQRIIQVVQRAAMLFRATPGRRGTVVELDESAEDVLIAGDLHGNLAHFQTILDRARLDRHPGRHLIVQELVHGPGRYANGGCKSHQLVDLVAALKCQYPARVHWLLGNHELAELSDRAILKGGIRVNELFRDGIEAAYGAQRAEVYAAYRELFHGLPLAVRTHRGVFASHSTPEAADLDAGFDTGIFDARSVEELRSDKSSALYALVWGRDGSEATARRFAGLVDAQLLVTGHMPCRNGFDTPNPIQLIVDSSHLPACCCLFSNRAPATLDLLLAGIQQL